MGATVPPRQRANREEKKTGSKEGTDEQEAWSHLIRRDPAGWRDVEQRLHSVVRWSFTPNVTPIPCPDLLAIPNRSSDIGAALPFSVAQACLEFPFDASLSVVVQP